MISEAWRRGVPAAILQQLDLQVEGMTPEVPGSTPRHRGLLRPPPGAAGLRHPDLRHRVDARRAIRAPIRTW
ncbi:hypothetical protein ACU4GD_12620 [Cupriavidus basilensis]